jgi:hypothetical protein
VDTGAARCRAVAAAQAPIDTGMNASVQAPVTKSGPARSAQKSPCAWIWDPHDVPLPRSPAEAAAVGRFVDAFERFDLDELVTLLTEDARQTEGVQEPGGPGKT